MSSVELDGGLVGGTYALTSNFAFDRIRNRFYTYYSGSLYGIDVNDPTNPILQTVDLLESPTNPLSGIVLSPDGTTLYVGRQDRHSLLTILTSSLFPPSGGEVGNPTPGPLPNPEGPISGTLNNFNAMPQAISADGRWLYGLREERKVATYNGWIYSYLQIVTLDLQSGTIYDESESVLNSSYSEPVDSHSLTYNEVKDEIYLTTHSGIRVFTTANNSSNPEYVGGYGLGVWPYYRRTLNFVDKAYLGVSSVTGNVYADVTVGDPYSYSLQPKFSEFSRNNVPDSFSVDTVTVASSPPTVIPTLDDIGDLVILEDAGLQQISISGISGSTSQPLQVTATSHNIGLIADPTVTYVSPDTAGSLAFTPVADRNGNATISVTVEAGGADHDLSTTEDNVSFSKTFAVTVTAVNDAATGSVVISGILGEDEVLTASNTLADVDGLGAISYQWKRDGMPIHGATNSTYTLVQEDVGAVMTVTANVTDNGGTAESMTSAATTEVINVNDIPTGTVLISGTAREDEVLTASHTLADQDGLGVISWQWNRDGVAVAGATDSTYTLVQADVGAVMTATASYTDGEGTPESVTSSPTTAVVNLSHSPTGSVTISGTAREDEVLTASHTLSDGDGLGVISWQWNRDGVLIEGATNSTYTLVQADVDASMTVTANCIDGEGTAESLTSAQTSAVVNVNDSPSGEVTIDGNPTQNVVLSANTSTLQDEDGLGIFIYQWLRDGMPISGANSSTHTLTQVDVSTQISVRVDYTDNEGTAESLTSAQTSAVVNVNDAPVLDPSASPQLNSVIEDAGAPVGQVGTLVSSLIDTGGTHDNFSDVDGDLPGIAITGVNLQGGTLWYSVDAGTTWANVGTVSESNPRLLAADFYSRIYYQPAAEFTGTVNDVISFRAWDRFLIWHKLGLDIDGEAAYDRSGQSVSLSADGQTVAIGAPSNDGNGNDSGHTRIYHWSGVAWQQLGQDIYGEADFNYSGQAVSLSADGRAVAIASAKTDNEYRHTRIYHWTGSTWQQLGLDIDGEAAGDLSGRSVSLSADGQTVAIGAQQNDGNGDDSGHTRIYYWLGSAWQQLGLDIDGEAAGDLSGHSVSLSADGQTVAIGAQKNDGNGDDSGHTRIYHWTGSTWQQLGLDIDGEAAGDLSGRSVSLSADGQTVAIGAWRNDGNGNSSGHTRIYYWLGSAWQQLGLDIDGEAKANLSGYSVSLSADGQTVAIGAQKNDGNGDDSGHTRIYHWTGSTWQQLGLDIDGEAAGDLSGRSVSLSADGQTVAIGAMYNGIDSGHTRIYQLTPSASSLSTVTDTISIGVTPVNDQPTLDAITGATIFEDAAEQVMSLSGISAGNGETQPLRVTASSSNPGLIPNPTISYESPDTIGSLAFTAVADQHGAATITVTVEDGGLDNDLATVGDNATFSQSFDVTVSAANDEPTLGALDGINILERCLRADGFAFRHHRRRWRNPTASRDGNQQ